MNYAADTNILETRMRPTISPGKLAILQTVIRSDADSLKDFDNVLRAFFSRRGIELPSGCINGLTLTTFEKIQVGEAHVISEESPL
jgi:hypothetical protein